KSSGWNWASRHRRSGRTLPSEHTLQTKRIRYRLPQFNCVCCLVSVEDRIEEIGKEDRHHNWAIFIRHPNHDHENHDMDESLQKLPVVHRADSGNKAQRSSKARTRETGIGRHCHSRLIRDLRWMSEPSCEAVLAINHSLHRSGAVGAQRFPAGAAISRSLNSGMVSAVHEFLLYVVADTTGGWSGAAAKTGWFSHWL